MKDNINIAYCCNNHFSNYISVSAHRISELHPNEFISLHIIHDDISNRNQIKLYRNLNATNIELKFYKTVDRSVEMLPCKNYTKYTWYRLLLPDILSSDLNKVLYLDVDTLVCGSLIQLFKCGIENFALAGVREDKAFMPDNYHRLGIDNDSQYINCGVLLMNLDYWRKNNLSEKIINWTQTTDKMLKYPDQDAINVLCKKSKKLLPLKYNVVNQLFLRENFYTKENICELNEAFYTPVVIHYAGCAPWILDGENHLFHEEWWNINRNLKYPVKGEYSSKGLLRLKARCWNILHPGFLRRKFSKIDIKDCIDAAKSRFCDA